MKAKILKNGVMFLLILIVSYSCSKKVEKPIIITYENNKLYVYPNNRGEDIDWYKANSLCENLEAFGFNDWYLPTIDELKVINDSIEGLGSLKPYWSSTEPSENTSNILLTGFLDKQILDQNKKSTATKFGNSFISSGSGNRCRCVRMGKNK